MSIEWALGVSTMAFTREKNINVMSKLNKKEYSWFFVFCFFFFLLFVGFLLKMDTISLVTLQVKI